MRALALLRRTLPGRNNIANQPAGTFGPCSDMMAGDGARLQQQQCRARDRPLAIARAAEAGLYAHLRAEGPCQQAKRTRVSRFSGISAHTDGRSWEYTDQGSMPQLAVQRGRCTNRLGI